MKSPVSLPLSDHPAPENRRAILDVPTEELKLWLEERRQPPMRVKQIRRQILAARATSFADMTDLPKRLRDDLDQHFVPFGTTVEKHLKSGDDTHKLLLRLIDGKLIECVLIQDDGRATACISMHVTVISRLLT